MNETLTKQIDALEPLLHRRKELVKEKDLLEKEIERVMQGDAHLGSSTAKNTFRSPRKTDENSIHSRIRGLLAENAEGLSTSQAFQALQAKFPGQSYTQKDVTLSLVYLTHKRHLAIRTGLGQYKLKAA